MCHMLASSARSSPHRRLVVDSACALAKCRLLSQRACQYVAHLRSTGDVLYAPCQHLHKTSPTLATVATLCIHPTIHDTRSKYMPGPFTTRVHHTYTTLAWVNGIKLIMQVIATQAQSSRIPYTHLKRRVLCTTHTQTVMPWSCFRYLDRRTAVQSCVRSRFSFFYSLLSRQTAFKTSAVSLCICKCLVTDAPGLQQ